MTERQQRFVEEYAVDGNGKQAAIRAGYSPATAEVQASRLLRDAKVAAAIESQRKERSERLGLTADWVLKQQRDLVKVALTRDTDGSVEIARKALRDIGDGIGMYVERHEHTGKDGGPIQMTSEEREARVLSLLEAAKRRKSA